jgi:23S rRNA (guanine745-N1)-methyltransferase
MLADVVEHLACPVCGASLALETGVLRCPDAHSFDVARQGYANLLTGNTRPGTADTAEMVRARDAFLDSGHFDPLMDALGDQVASGLGRADDAAHSVSAPAPVVLDAGAGTAHYLRAVLDRAPGTVGLALDISKHAARRAARAHPHIGAIVADLWRPLPIQDAAADALINVFAPRNAQEFHRVLKLSGRLHAVTPSREHLGPLVSTLGLLSVDEEKDQRMDTAFAGHFVLERRQTLDAEAMMSHDDVTALVGMGPSAHHVAPEDLSKRIAELPEPIPVPLSFVLSVYRPAGA